MRVPVCLFVEKSQHRNPKVYYLFRLDFFAFGERANVGIFFHIEVYFLLFNHLFSRIDNPVFGNTVGRIIRKFYTPNACLLSFSCARRKTRFFPSICRFSASKLYIISSIYAICSGDKIPANGSGYAWCASC